MDKILLAINNATVKGTNGIIFKRLNFKLFAGQHLAVIGESGAGKTALLQTIAGRLNVTQGSTTYNFLNHPDDSESTNQLNFRDFIALVDTKHHFKNLANTNEFYYQQRFNSSDSEDALTVEQYLNEVKPAIFVNNYWNVTKVTALFGLADLLSKQIIKLSNGETKRLLIAAALLKNPVILLLDNPLTGLDIQTRNEFNEIINKIIASGITVIMAASPFEIPAAITHVAIINNGVIEQAVKRDQYNPLSTKKDPRELSEAILALRLAGYKNICEYESIVQMNDVTIKYGDKTILNKVNWQILPGERWALLGPNGAGKSTLLSLINGDNPQAYANGIILFDKKRGTGESIWDIKSKIGFVSPELYQYFPNDNSCLQVVESGFYDTLGLFRPSVKTKSDIALNWMKALEIDKYARVLLKNIPASAQRLCLLARAMVKNPPLLIFDEPCQGLDEEQQLHFKNILDTICNLSNVTLIYVTHYQHEIPDSVTKVLKLESGLVI